jgi:hypothetical protein
MIHNPSPIHSLFFSIGPLPRGYHDGYTNLFKQVLALTKVQPPTMILFIVPSRNHTEKQKEILIELKKYKKTILLQEKRKTFPKAF